MTTLHNNKEMHWKEWTLMFLEQEMCTLIPHDFYARHYHLKFSWRAEKTPEFFNLVNAKENARIYSLGYLNKDVNEARRKAAGEFK